jgi:polysaccharide biosynthesis transport protein
MGSGPLVPANGQFFREIPFTLPADFNRQGHPGNFSSNLSQDSPLRDYLRILIKRKWTVLGSVALIFSLVAIATFRSTRIYEAVGSIAINHTDPVLLNIKGATSEMPGYYDPADLDTEVRVLKSDLLALQVIKEMNLDKLPEFGGHPDSSGNTLALTTDSLQIDSAHTSALLSTFKYGLSVSLLPDSRVIEIRYRCPDPALAARIVNTLINTYEEQNFKSRYESTMEASDWLSKQLVDLQMKVETSQEKLVQYQKEHEIFAPDDKENIVMDKLDELNKELTQAETDRMEKESVFDLMRSSDPGSLAAAAGAAESASGNTGASSLLDQLRGQETGLRIQIAQLSTQFGPAYPQIVQLNNQLKEVHAQIQIEARKVLERVHNDYMAAVTRENMLRAAMDQQKQQANQMNQSAIEYSLLKRDVDTNRTLYEGLLEKLKEAGITAGLHSTNIRKVDQARTPTSPAEPKVPRNLAFALALGLCTGVSLAFFQEAMDNTVRTPEQAQIISGLPSLGMIPMGSRSIMGSSKQKLALASSKEAVELVTQARPQSQMAESYRALRTSLLLTSVGAPPKTILVTSALPQEGKTTTSINCAIALAQKGSRVLLIDADLRRPSIHKTFGMGSKAGLSNVLTGNASLEQSIIGSPFLPSLFVLPAGTPPPNPAELLASANIRELLAQLQQQYDHIVIDTPPALSVTDAVVLSPKADAVVLVIRAGQTTKQALRRSRDLLLQVNARVAGVLLNAVDLNSPDYYYYYEYQGKYGQRYYREESFAQTKENTTDAGSAIG